MLQGVIPASRQEVVGASVFNFVKSEAPIWFFSDVEYHNVQKQVHFTGGSSGIGFRVARGVYVRTGGFRGRRYTTEETTHADGRRLLADA